MIELVGARTHLLKRVLPFALALLAGVSSFQAFSGTRPEPPAPLAAAGNAARATAGHVEPREPPEVNVLSPMLMSEVRDFELRGGRYTGPLVISPLRSHFAPRGRRDGVLRVLQVSFLFGADGTISEVAPRDKPADCGTCLKGVKVARIDPRDPRSREYVEAATEAVRRIEFEPGTLGGRPVATHGLAECIFRFDLDGEFIYD